MMRRLAVLFSATLLLTVLVAIPASAHDYSFELSVDGTATLNEFKTVLTIKVEYTCLPGDFDEGNSGLGGSVFQSRKGGKVIVEGGLGFGGDQLGCDGFPQVEYLDVQAFVGDTPAVWKRGRVLVTVGGNVCNETCDEVAGHAPGDGVTRSVRITK